MITMMFLFFSSSVKCPKRSWFPEVGSKKDCSLLIIYANLFEKKYIAPSNKKKIKIKNTKKIIKLTPETKIKLSHVRNVNKVWPTSGWAINNNVTGINIKKLKKNL